MKRIIISLFFLGLAFISIFSYKTYVKPTTVSLESVFGKEFFYKDKNVITDQTIVFSKNGFYGFSGVNRYFAGYQIDGNNIKFSPIGSTMMAGEQIKMDSEKVFLDLLNSVDKINVYKDKLVLLTKNNKKLSFIFKNKNELLNNISNEAQIKIQNIENEAKDEINEIKTEIKK